MPEKVILEKYTPDPSFDHAAMVAKRADKVRAHFEEVVAQIDAITDRELQLLCMFSLIDCMAQEWANYPSTKTKSEQDVFCDFVLNHQTKYSFLKEIDPITLYYDVEDEIGFEAPQPGFPLIKRVTLTSPWLRSVTKFTDFVHLGKADEIARELRKTKAEEHVARKLERHRLIRLIYRLRSKVTHELSPLGDEHPLMKPYQCGEPYYREVGRKYIEDGNVVTDHVYELIIPNDFIREIMLDCMDQYLMECVENDHAPFENNSFMRRFRITWYDR